MYCHVTKCFWAVCGLNFTQVDPFESLEEYFIGYTWQEDLMSWLSNGPGFRKMKFYLETAHLHSS